MTTNITPREALEKIAKYKNKSCQGCGADEYSMLRARIGVLTETIKALKGIATQALAPQEQNGIDLKRLNEFANNFKIAPQECDVTGFKFDSFENASNQIFELAKRINDDCINADGCSFKKGAFVGQYMINCLNIMRDEYKQLRSQQKISEHIISLSENNFDQLVEACRNPQANEKLKESLQRPLMFEDCTQQKTFTLEEIKEL